MECPNCTGRGEVRRFNPATKGRWLEQCPECLGTGVAMSPLQRQARTFVRRPKRWVPAVLAALAIGLATFFALRSLLEVEPDTPERQPPELPEP